MPENDSSTTADPCTTCGGLLVFTQDQDGTYLRCMQCGRHVFPDEQLEHLEYPQEDPEDQDAGRDCAWYPVRDETMARYRELGEIILREKLSPAAAQARFGISRRTFYRIRSGARALE